MLLHKDCVLAVVAAVARRGRRRSPFVVAEEERLRNKRRAEEEEDDANGRGRLEEGRTRDSVSVELPRDVALDAAAVAMVVTAAAAVFVAVDRDAIRIMPPLLLPAACYRRVVNDNKPS
jgi:hypothetical protein